MRRILLRHVLALPLVVAACHAGVAPPAPAGPALAALTRYQPAHDLGSLFAAVQLARLFPDSKTFADATPRFAPGTIAAEYARDHSAPGFDLHAFVANHFTLPEEPDSRYRGDTSQTMVEHIEALWPVLARAPPADTAPDRNSLVPLPHPYVVPGGRFREVYYWDSYFTMLGLVRSGRLDLVRGMLDNFAWLLQTFGHIPNGNRTYYLSRSQPPFFGAMVSLYIESTDSLRSLPYLEPLRTEHRFWMEGAPRLHPGEAHRRVVRLPDGTILNRYWDDLAEPRPESYREDFTLAESLPAGQREHLYREIRATAESGWDFSSRWLRDPRDLRTLETTELAPVDLNALLAHTERLIAALLRLRAAPGDSAEAVRLDSMAGGREAALRRLAWDPASGFFHDVYWRSGRAATDRPTLAAAVPLYFDLATPEQGRRVAERLAEDFLRPGGLVTTLVASGQQWDAPNGWAPLEWMAIEGMRRYGATAMADTARSRWLALLQRTYRATGRMLEKYDVVDLARRAGGGEYPTQDGFGWTNGVALALLRP